MTCKIAVLMSLVSTRLHWLSQCLFVIYVDRHVCRVTFIELFRSSFRIVRKGYRLRRTNRAITILNKPRMRGQRPCSALMKLCSHKNQYKHHNAPRDSIWVNVFISVGTTSRLWDHGAVLVDRNLHCSRSELSVGAQFWRRSTISPLALCNFRKQDTNGTIGRAFAIEASGGSLF